MVLAKATVLTLVMLCGSLLSCGPQECDCAGTDLAVKKTSWVWAKGNNVLVIDFLDSTASTYFDYGPYEVNIHRRFGGIPADSLTEICLHARALLAMEWPQKVINGTLVTDGGKSLHILSGSDTISFNNFFYSDDPGHQHINAIHRLVGRSSRRWRQMPPDTVVASTRFGALGDMGIVEPDTLRFRK